MKKLLLVSLVAVMIAACSVGTGNVSGNTSDITKVDSITKSDSLKSDTLKVDTTHKVIVSCCKKK
jgi:uncharacterized protein YcfL